MNIASWLTISRVFILPLAILLVQIGSGQAGDGTQNSKENPGITTPTLVPSLQNGGPGSKTAIAEGGLPGGGPDLNGGMVKYGAGYLFGSYFRWCCFYLGTF